MILIITSKLDPHTDAVIGTLKQRNLAFCRFNTEDFPQKVNFSYENNGILEIGDISFPSGKSLSLNEITSCWYRRPLTPEISSNLQTEQAKKFALEESQAFLNFLWNRLDCLWVNHPLLIRKAESKMLQLKIASSLGFDIPKTLITNRPEAALKFIKGINSEVINKVLGAREIEYQNDYYFVYAHKVEEKDLINLDEISYAPTMFQEYIPKSLEIRVTVIGERVFACEIHSQDSDKTKDDWRHYDFDNVKHSACKLPREIEEKCLGIVKSLSLNFGTIDLILTPENKYVFLEINPNGQQEVEQNYQFNG